MPEQNYTSNGHNRAKIVAKYKDGNYTDKETIQKTNKLGGSQIWRRQGRRPARAMFSKINSIWSPVLPNLVGVEVNKTSCFWRKYDMESSHPQPCGGNMTIFWGVKQYGSAGGAKVGVKQNK